VTHLAAVLVVAVAIGLDNFGAAVALGISGVDSRFRLRLALVFGIFEAAMPIVGLVIGRSAAAALGTVATYVAGALIGAMGIYAVVISLVERHGQRAGRGGSAPTARDQPGLARLVLLGAALSIDNLVIGFALGTYDVNIVVAVAVIAVVSVGLALLGLELGRRLGSRFGANSELVGGGLLIVVGFVIGSGVV
jgi:manganese efflux pump family protein